MSINWHSDAEPSPALLVLPPDAASLDEAHAAIELWEHYTGKTLDPTQRLVVEVMMAEDADGNWAASTTGREMPRQNGKGDEVEVVELWGLVQRAEAILHTIHEAVLLSTQTQQRMLGVLDSHADLRRLKSRAWVGTGQQMIELRNGGIIWYRTRTKGGGRGLDDVSRIVMDEAQHVTGEQMAASTPTGFANGNNQLNMLGTSGLPNESGEWWRTRRRAMSDNPGRFGYVGHTAEKFDDSGAHFDDDPADEDLWRRVNPALARRGESGLVYLREQFHRLGPIRFAQEHLGVWAPDPGQAYTVGPIPLDVWSSLVDGHSVPIESTAVMAIDTNPERSWFTAGLAGEREDGLIHVEVTKSHPDRSFIIDFAVSASERITAPIVVTDGALAADLERAGVKVDVMKPGEFAAATSALIDATRGEAPRVRHQGEPLLRTALEAAQTKPYGDGGVTWSRRSTSTDISPLTAATMAFGRLGVGSKILPEPFVVFS